MWVAKTTTSDGIAIVVFATVLFLILFGGVSLVKWFLRLISGKPNPSKFETVVLVLEYDVHEDCRQPEDYENIRSFAFYLHSKLAEQKIGQFAAENHDDTELLLYFVGPNANQIWDSLADEVKKYSPNKPERVILKRTKKMNEAKVLKNIPWQPSQNLHFQTPSAIEIPERWLPLSNISHLLSIFGISGIAGWKALRIFLGLTENEFMKTGLGMASAYLVGIALISGLSLKLICMNRINTIRKAAGFFDWEPSTSNTLKYVLLIVFTIFGLILFLT